MLHLLATRLVEETGSPTLVSSVAKHDPQGRVDERLFSVLFCENHYFLNGVYKTPRNPHVCMDSKGRHVEGGTCYKRFTLSHTVMEILLEICLCGNCTGTLAAGASFETQ